MKNIMLTVDAIVEKNGKVVLITRGHEPHTGKLALPGGKVEKNERTEDAVVREAFEETSVRVKPLEILGVYSGNDIDPRGYASTTVFVTKILSGKLKGADDATKADFYDLKKLDFNRIGFWSHRKILKDFLKWKKSGGTFWLKK